MRRSLSHDSHWRFVRRWKRCDPVSDACTEQRSHWPGFQDPPCSRHVRTSSVTCRRVCAERDKAPVHRAIQALLGQLGDLMADPGRETRPTQLSQPASLTSGSSSITTSPSTCRRRSTRATDANTVHNMRTPALDLDSLYGRGPALEPFLYVVSDWARDGDQVPAGHEPQRRAWWPGRLRRHTRGHAGASRLRRAARTQSAESGNGAQTAIIGDPRNDENLIVVQFHHAMLRFHNQVVDLLLWPRLHRRHLRRGQADRHPPLPVGRRERLPERVCGRPPVTASLGTL